MLSVFFSGLAAFLAAELPESALIDEVEIYLAYGRLDLARKTCDNALETYPASVRMRQLRTELDSIATDIDPTFHEPLDKPQSQAR